MPNTKPKLWKFRGYWNCVGQNWIAQGLSFQEAYKNWAKALETYNTNYKPKEED